MTSADIEAVRKNLRDRVSAPGKFDAPPPFMKNIPKDDITEADVDLWHSAEEAWFAHRDAEDRRFVAKMDRRRKRLYATIIIAAVVYLIYQFAR